MVVIGYSGWPRLTGRAGVAACGETSGLLRASFGFGTTTDDLDRLVSGLAAELSAA
jgi:selenocysteine lyase/cysteine desulfurase